MRIAIIGGGIGGLTAALALRRFGFEPEVFEQAPALLEVGAAILMWPNAMRILHRLGLSHAIRESGGVLEQGRWLRFDGKLLNHFWFPKTEIPAIALHRAKLQNVLLDALPRESIHLDHVFEKYEHLSDGIVAFFNNGRSFECDALIGADGLHSRARTQLLNDGPATARGYIAWRGVVASPSTSISPGTAYEIYGSGRRFGIGTLGSGKVGWWASANESLCDVSERNQNDKAEGATVSTSESEETHTHKSIVSADERTRAELLRLFDGWWEPVIELIHTTPLTSVVRNVVCDRAPVRKWGEGPMTLLGDAIHPITPNLGQGGCLAIEDAAVLARCLETHGSNGCPDNKDRSSIPAAMRKFETLRFSRTAMIRRYSRIYGVIGQWENPLAVRLRRLGLSLVPTTLTERFLGSVFDYDAYAVSI